MIDRTSLYKSLKISECINRFVCNFLDENVKYYYFLTSFIQFYFFLSIEKLQSINTSCGKANTRIYRSISSKKKKKTIILENHIEICKSKYLSSLHKIAIKRERIKSVNSTFL